MIRKFRVCFYLRSYKTKDGKSPILVRLYLNGERMILGSAGFNVEEKQWDKSKGRVKGRTSEANKVNEALEQFIAPNCGFYTAGHPLEAVERNLGLEYAKPIRVGNNVWFGANVTVVPGVTIGDNCVIGAGSVVVKDIPDNSLAVGNPCRVIRTIKNTI